MNAAGRPLGRPGCSPSTGWASIYAVSYIPWLLKNQIPLAMAGDTMFLVSLFVLGGGCWDKIRALFIYEFEG